MFPGAGADAAEALGGQIRTFSPRADRRGLPAAYLGGISTYPFDGAKPTSLLRAADQALYAAKAAGKDRIASFRDLTHSAPRPPPQRRPVRSPGASGEERGSGAVLTDAMAAARRSRPRQTVEGVCARLCKALVFVVGATACSASRVLGDYIVDATEHALREVSLGDEAAYRIADFPLTADVLRSGEPRAVSFMDGDVDPSEAFILRDLGMNALLMLPIRVGGRMWGSSSCTRCACGASPRTTSRWHSSSSHRRSGGSRSSRARTMCIDVRASTSCRRTPARRASRARDRHSAGCHREGANAVMRATTNSASSMSKANPSVS